jgi:ABC-type Na+ transport system ATPase subunit NatA
LQVVVTISMLISCFFNKVVILYLAATFIVCILALLSLLINQFMLDPLDELEPFPLFLIAPIAYYRAIHLLFTRTYTFDYLQGEMASIFTYLLIDCGVYAVLALYLDQVMPRQFGVVVHPLFFLGPCQPKCTKVAAQPTVDPSEDKDVTAERARIDGKATPPSEYPIVTTHLRKVYGGEKVAVNDLCLSIQKEECFGLLGPNGAGKTSTISMWTGLYKPTAGTAYICGFDLRTHMHKIYELIGVCPQFDILWPLLTVKETLRFYCLMKGATPSAAGEQAQLHARSVDLMHVSSRMVGKLSGGMKRRVSLAISLVGDPKVVFLDEPTTGLDPETKRAMWSLVDSAKACRSIVLTTHSMEEADALVRPSRSTVRP